MNKNERVEIRLSGVELAAVLEGLGLKKMYGFELTREGTTKYELITAIQHLVERGYLHPEDNFYRIDGTARALILRIMHSFCTIRLQSFVPPAKNLCLYLGQTGTTVIEPSENQKDTFFLYQVQPKKFILDEIRSVTNLKSFGTDKVSDYSKDVFSINVYRNNENMVHELMIVDKLSCIVVRVDGEEYAASTELIDSIIEEVIKKENYSD